MGFSDINDDFVAYRHKVISIKALCLEGRKDRLLGWCACSLPGLDLAWMRGQAISLDIGLVFDAP